MKTFAIAMAAGLASSAAGDVITSTVNPLGMTASAASMDLGDFESTNTTDGYFLAPGIGGAGGFALAGTGVIDSTFDGAAEAIGTALSGNILAGFDATISGSFAVPNSNAVFQISVFDNGGADLTPSGFTVGGLPADQSGLFLGANAGGNPLDFAIPVTLNQVLMFGLDAAGGVVYAIDVTGILVANNLNGDGTYNGSAGVVLGAPSVDLGVVEIGYQFDVTTVPAPASAALLGLGGLVAVRRRR